MPERHVASCFPAVVLCGAALGLAVPSIAHGSATEWCATSGVLPSDASIPERDRFELVDEKAFASLNGDVLEIDDTVAQFGVAAGAIGFIDTPSTQWIPNASVAMDTTDAPHAYGSPRPVPAATR